MRRSVLNALATVSLAALVSVATSTQAITPQSFGALNQVDKWKVGIVDPEGQSFCAMVNKFDKNVGLAFALSPEGYGSLAVDVASETFKPGDTYQVQLRTNGKNVAAYPGRATSPRSVVVQIGQNDKFYDALKSNAKLGIGMPQLDAEFAITKFSNFHRQLVDCAHSLVTGVKGGDGRMPAVKVKDVEKASLAPLDKELADLSGQQVVSNDTPATDKAALFEDAENAPAQVASEAKVQLASLGKQQQQVIAEIGEQKQKAAEIVEERQQVERKLIASARQPSSAAPAATADTGATARLWDEKQVISQSETQALAAQADKAGAHRIAVLEAVRNQASQEQEVEFKQQRDQYDAKVTTLEKQVQITQVAKVAAPADKALKASLVAKQAEIAHIKAERNEQAQALNEKLAATQTTYRTQIEQAAAERDALKKQLADARSEAEFNKARSALLQSQLAAAATAGREASAEKKELAALQEKLAKAEQEKQAMETRLSAVDRQSKLLNATLGQKQKELEKTAQGSKELDLIKVEVARMQASSAVTIDSLKKELAQQKAQYADLQKQSQNASAGMNAELSRKHHELSGQLTRKEAYVSDLEHRLAQLEAERTEAAKRAEAATAQLAVAQKDAKVARKSLIIINEDELPVGLTKREAAAAVPAPATVIKEVPVTVTVKDPADAARAEKAQASLNEAQAKISELETQLSAARELAEKQKSAPATKPVVEQEQALNDQRSKLDAAQAEIQRLIAKNSELAGKLYNDAADGRDTTAQSAELKGQRGQIETAQAEIERLKAENLTLSGKLVNAVNVAKAAPAVAAPVEVAAADTAKEELVSSRLRIAELETQLRETQVTQKALPAAVPARSFVNAPVAFAPSSVQPAQVQAVTLADADEQLSPVVTTPLPQRNPGKGVRMAKIGKEVDVTADILAIEPAAGDVRLVSAVPAIPPAQVIEQKAPLRTFFDYTAASVKKAPVVTSAPAPGTAPGFDHNRAAAFLDRIMAQHRPAGGAKAPAHVADATPVFSATPKRTVAVAVPVTQGLSDIETAAGPSEPKKFGYTGNRSQRAVETPVFSAPANGAINVEDGEFPAPVTAAPLSEPVVRTPSVKSSSAVRGSGIEAILAQAGIDDADVGAPEQDEGGVTVRRWTTGGISGMQEQFPAKGAFAANVANYIERYREDCSALRASLGAPEQTRGGVIAQADISCPTEGNTYSTSFVFWQQGSTFNALLHSGYPADAAAVKTLGDRVASAVAGGAVASAAPAPQGMSPRLQLQSADAVVAPVAERPQYRFNVPQESSAEFAPLPFATRPSGGAPHDFDTVVIE